MPQVMPAGFEPRKRGRRPAYDIKDVLNQVDAIGHNNWVKFEVTPLQARSAKHQFDKLPDYEVGIEQSTVMGQAFLYVRKR